MSDNSKYQWSKSVKGEIYVIRADDFEEFEKNKAEMIKHIGVEEFGREVEEAVKPSTPSKLTTEAVKQAETKICPIEDHDDAVMTGKEGKFGWFYSHKTDAGTWCNGKHKEY